MKTFTVSTLAGLVALAQAVEFTNSNFDIVPGEDFELTWADANGPVTILLRQGDPEDLRTLDTVVSDVEGSAFTWSVPDNLPDGDDYALEINDGGEPNYSEQFPLSGGGEPEPTEEESSATPSATSSESSVSSVVSSSSVEESTSTVESSTETVTVTSSPIPSETSEVSSSVESTSESASVTESDSASETGASPTGEESGDEEEVPDSKAGRLGSPVALILTVAAILYFN